VNAQDNILLKMTFWVSQGRVVTFSRRGGQYHKHLGGLSSEFYIPKIVKIG